MFSLSPEEWTAVGVSVDGVWCHAAFAHDRKLHFPLLADFEPKGAVARQYGAYRDADGTSERALFVNDKDGVIRWSYLYPVAVNPGADGILDKELLAEMLRESFRRQPGKHIAGSAGAKGNDDAHRARRIGISPRGARHCRKHCCGTRRS